MSDAKGFAAAINQWNRQTTERTQRLFRNVVDAAHRSIVFGSPITSAPGQPVKTGALKWSWKVMYETPERAIIYTDIFYAPYIESGVSPIWGPLTLRSSVGGFHSVKLTAQNVDLLIADEAKKL